MRRNRQLVPALLVAVFWLAQVQGTVHAIGHLTAAQSLSQRATVPHGVFCVECAAFAQAGAAPVAAPLAPLLAAPTEVAHVTPVLAAIAAEPAASYRSRAPPTSPI